MKAEFQEIKKSHYYSQGDSIITRDAYNNPAARYPEFYPMSSHETEHVATWLLENFPRINYCGVINVGLYATIPVDGQLGSFTLKAIGIELPQDRAEEVCEIIKTIRGL